MRIVLPVTIVASALLAVNAKWTPTSGQYTWDYLIGAENSEIVASKKQVINIDLEKAQQFVPQAHNKGQKVVCYFSGGTMQESRKIDYQDYVNAGVGIPGTKSSWGNQYVDIRNKSKLQPLIRRRMERAKSYGCDAVEVDSLGLYIHKVKDYTEEDTYVFAKWVAETAHSVGLPIGLKNVALLATRLEPYFDFAIVESCANSPNVCNYYYTSFTKHNKAVFTVHYTDSYSLSGSSRNTLTKELGGRGFTCILTDKLLKHSSTVFDCSSGSPKEGSSLPNVEQQAKVTKTTTVKKTVTTTVKINPTQNPVKQNPANSANSANSANPTNPTKPTIPTNSVNSVNPVTPGSQTPGAQTPGAQSTEGTPATPVTPGAPGAQGVPGAEGSSVTPGVPGAEGAQVVPVNPGAKGVPVSSAVGGNSNTISKDANGDKENSEGGNSIGTALAVFGGVAATAAIGGFIFVKKNKKYSSDEQFLGY